MQPGAHGIGGVFFKASDPKGLQRWYEEKLGLPTSDGFIVMPWRRDTDPARRGKTVLGLFRNDTTYFAPSEASFMINFRVDDLEGMIAALRGRGVEVTNAEEHPEGRFAWLSDPEGHRIELWQPTGEASAPGERTLVLETEVDASLGAVWEAWTTDEGLRSFFAPKCHVELAPGGAFEILFDLDAPEGQQGSEGMRVMAFEPKTMLSFTWNFPPHLTDIRPMCTLVVLRFLSVSPTRTRVRLTQTGWGAGASWKEGFTYFERAWGAVVFPQLQKRFTDGPVDWDRA